MNISRMTLVRPVAVAVIAVGLVGCSVLSPTEPVADTSTRTVAESPAPDTTADQAIQTDDDEEDVGNDGPSDHPVLEAIRDRVAERWPGSATAPGTAPAPAAEPEDWTAAVPKKDWESDSSTRPPSPSPLVHYLPESSVLRADGAKLGPPYTDSVASPEPGGAVTSAVMLIKGAAILVNDGSLEYFSPVAAATCIYCLGKLRAAYDIHDGGAVQDQPWALDISTEAKVQELSGSDHLLLEFEGEENSLVYRIKNQTILTDFEGRKIFRVEMLFDQGQWWVIGVSTHEV